MRETEENVNEEVPATCEEGLKTKPNSGDKGGGKKKKFGPGLSVGEK